MILQDSPRARQPVLSPYSTPTASTAPRDRVQLTPLNDGSEAEASHLSTGAKVAMAFAMAVPLLAGATGSAASMPLRPEISQSVTTTASGITQNNVQLVTDDTQALITAQDMIQNATQSVRFESPALSGVQGEEIARSLVGKAQDGKNVKVQVLLDRRNYNRHSANRVWVDYMKKNGVDVKFYEGGRDNDNLLIVDLNKALTGGQSFTTSSDHTNNLLIQGPGVADLRTQWNTGWLAAGGQADSEVPPAADPNNPAPAPNASVQVMDGKEARTHILDLINNSHISIQMEIHGLADSQVINALRAARQRGVEVNVILNDATCIFSKVDNAPAAGRFADRPFVPLRWYEAEPHSELGTHMAIFDGNRAVIGSTDLPNKHQEKKDRSVDLDTTSPDLLGKLNTQFLQDWQYHAFDRAVISEI